MRVYGLKCGNCLDIIWSRARHDYILCTCRNIGTDGGQDVGATTRTTTALGATWKYVTLELHGVQKKDMYDDWNFSLNKLGRIKAGTVDLRQQVIDIDEN
jgi:hypothetical protein